MRRPRPPAIEHELVAVDGALVRSGRTRKRQFVWYPRPTDPPPARPISPWAFA